MTQMVSPFSELTPHILSTDDGRFPLALSLSFSLVAVTPPSSLDSLRTTSFDSFPPSPFRIPQELVTFWPTDTAFARNASRCMCERTQLFRPAHPKFPLSQTSTNLGDSLSDGTSGLTRSPSPYVLPPPRTTLSERPLRFVAVDESRMLPPLTLLFDPSSQAYEVTAFTTVLNVHTGLLPQSKMSVPCADFGLFLPVLGRCCQRQPCRLHHRRPRGVLRHECVGHEVVR